MQECSQGCLWRTGAERAKKADSDGNEVGWAHLAYSNGKAEGTLFVKYGMRDIAELSKYSRTPMIE